MDLYGTCPTVISRENCEGSKLCTLRTLNCTLVLRVWIQTWFNPKSFETQAHKWGHCFGYRNFEIRYCSLYFSCSRAAVLKNRKAKNHGSSRIWTMNPKHFTTIRHSLPAKMRLTIWPSVLHLKTGRFRELNMLAKKLWQADDGLVALKQLPVGWFRSSCIMLVLLLIFTPLRASSNRTNIPNIHTESMTIFHVPFISATYSTLWSWACLQIYWYKYNLIQSLSYTQLQMFANSQNMWRFAMFQQRFGTKLIFQSWRIEWFPCDFEVIHSQVGQKFWPQWRPLQVDFVSSLIAQLQILRLMSKWPQGSNRFQMGRIQWIILVKFAWKLLGYFYCVCL